MYVVLPLKVLYLTFFPAHGLLLRDFKDFQGPPGPPGPPGRAGISHQYSSSGNMSEILKMIRGRE